MSSINSVFSDRKTLVNEISQADAPEWDLIIIGGGITGAAVLREAVRCGSSQAATGKRWQKLEAAGAQAIVDSGGTISHQHGVGVDHKAYLMAEKGPLGIAAIRNLSEMFDPPGLMNPGKLLPDAEERT